MAKNIELFHIFIDSVFLLLRIACSVIAIFIDWMTVLSVYQLRNFLNSRYESPMVFKVSKAFLQSMECLFFFAVDMDEKGPKTGTGGLNGEWRKEKGKRQNMEWEK